MLLYFYIHENDGNFLYYFSITLFVRHEIRRKREKKIGKLEARTTNFHLYSFYFCFLKARYIYGKK
jgi:hypothetical protein